MNAQELITKYHLELGQKPDGTTFIKLPLSGLRNKDAARAEILAARDEIIAALEAEEKARMAAVEERHRKLDAIPGLKEIIAAQNVLAEWNARLNASFEGEGGGGVGIGPMPKTNIKALRERYPVADAYLRAEAEALKENFELSAIGKRAVEEILDSPGNYANIIQKMEDEIHNFTLRHIWD